MRHHQHDAAPAVHQAAPDRRLTPETQTPAVGAGAAGGQGTGSTAILPEGPDARKALATLAARCSLAGYELHELAGGELLLTRWGRSRSLADAQAVEQFLGQVTGQRT
jgi:hypothetical protein